MKLILKTMTLIFTLSSYFTYSADLIDADEIIQKANLASYYTADDGRTQARMLIVDGQGNKQMRQFTILRKDRVDLGDQDILVFFSKPTDVQGTVFRVTKKVNADDDRWLYLPALDLVKRISAGDKRTSFVGAHFFYEDVSGRNPQEDNFTLLSTTDKFYTLKASPKDKNSVEFDHYIVNIDKASFLPMKVDYFNGQNEKTRTMEVVQTEVIDGFTTVMHSKITQHSDGSYTEMQFKNVKYNLGLPDSIFSERSLRTPPKAWL